MAQQKTNIYSVNFTPEDKRTLLKQMILDMWIKKHHPDIIEKIEKFVQENVDDAE